MKKLIFIFLFTLASSFCINSAFSKDRCPAGTHKVTTTPGRYRCENGAGEVQRATQQPQNTGKTFGFQIPTKP